MQSNLQNVYIWQKLNREKIEQYLFNHSQTNSTISWPVGELKFMVGNLIFHMRNIHYEHCFKNRKNNK